MSSVTIKNSVGTQNVSVQHRDTSNGYRTTIRVGRGSATLCERDALDLAAYLASMLGGVFVDRNGDEQRTIFNRRPA